MNEQAYRELVDVILSILPAQTLRIVLFGSRARGTASPDSDIDIALFISERLSHQQQDQLDEVIVDLDLKYDCVFSVIDIDWQTYMKWRHVSPFYQNVDREGIVLWETKTEDLEYKLDEADRMAESSDLRLTGAEVFERARQRVLDRDKT